MSARQIAGRLSIGWSIDESDFGIDSERELTAEELLTLCDQLRDALGGAISQCVSIFIHGPEYRPVQVHFDHCGIAIDVEEGPEAGDLEDLAARTRCNVTLLKDAKP